MFQDTDKESKFKKLCNEMLAAAMEPKFEAAAEALKGAIELNPLPNLDGQQDMSFVHAFKSIESPESKLAEVIHAQWYAPCATFLTVHKVAVNLKVEAVMVKSKSENRRGIARIQGDCVETE